RTESGLERTRRFMQLVVAQHIHKPISFPILYEHLNICGHNSVMRYVNADTLDHAAFQAQRFA
ncbi:MAG: hypothetical protein ACPGGB_11200, partial [Flavobacteriales bacterium]